MRSHRFDRFELTPAERQLRADGQPLVLGARAFDLLLALVEHRDRVVTKDELLDLVWPGLVVEEANVQVQISALRKLLGPAAIATVPGRGYRFTARLEEPGAETAPPKVAPRVLHNLPQPRTHFIGREAALADGERLLDDARLLTLTGVGGCGKTRLALQLAQRRIDRHADGVWFIDLAPLQDGERVAAAVAAVLDVREEAGTPVVDRLAAQLAARALLLVLDNCEHVVEAAADMAEALLGACPRLQIIATSRESLHVAGEQILQVRPLTLPASAEPGAMAGSEAVRLFIDRARLTVPDFDVDVGNAAAVGEICRRLDGMALAIELAAARVRLLPVAEISARLDDRFRFLHGGARALPRHQTLEAALQWSFDSLSSAEQQLLGEMSVFAGGCSLEAALAVCGVTARPDGSGTDAFAVMELLGSLQDKSLLVVDRAAPPVGDGEPRYRLLETVRQYAQRRFAGPSAVLDAAHDRHLLHFAAMAEAALQALQGPQQGEWMAQLRREQENLLAAHGWSAQAADGVDAGLQLVGGLSRYWLNSGQLERGYALACEALKHAGHRGDAIWRARALQALGTIAFRMGRYDEALQAADGCLALARASNDTLQLTHALSLRAKGLHSTGQLELALACSEEACATARTLGKTVRLSAALNNLAEVHRSLGHLAEAEACYGESIALTRELRYAGGCFVSLCNVTRLLVGAGQPERARATLLESWDLWSAASLKGMSKDLLEGSAGLAALLQENTLAARFGGAALARLEEAGIQREPVDEAFIAPLLAQVREHLGAAAYADAHDAGHSLSAESAMAEVRAWLAHEPVSAPR